MNKSINDLIIIGGGPAGLTAALYARRSGYDVLLFENNLPGGKLNLTLEIDNYPGAPKSEGAALATTMFEQAESAGAQIVYERVTGIDLANGRKTVITEAGEYFCRALIIASGAEHRTLGVPGEERLQGQGVSYCAICDGGFFKGKDVAVCGGGDTALEEAQYLAKICSKVYLIHRRETFRGSAANVERTRSLPNVELVLGANVAEIMGDKRVEGVRVLRGSNGSNNSESVLPVSAVFIAVGSVPVTTFVTPGMLALNPNGGIAADAALRTSVPGVFAAGDVRNPLLRQIVTATADGALAASSAARYLSGDTGDAGGAGVRGLFEKRPGEKL